MYPYLTKRNHSEYNSIFQTNKLIEEKDEHIEQLKERIHVLEQRFQGQGLSGDDRVSALESEVSTNT